jgi:hypothetical protein
MVATSVHRLCLAVAVTLPFALDAAAQAAAEGQVTVDSAIIWRSDVAAPFATVPVGTSLEVTAQSSRWYEVVIPESLGGRGARGLIARSQLRIVGDPAAIPRRALRGDPPVTIPPGTRRADTPPRSAPAAQQARGRRRGRVQGLVFVNGMFQTTSTDFADSLSFPENAEQAEIETAYTVESIRGFAAGAAAMLSPRFGVGGSVERSTTTTPAALSGTIPHPFFFAAGRGISAQIAGLEREELALHAEIRATWPVSARLQLSAVGGPSLFRVSQGIVSDVSYVDSYPYDEARFSGSDTVTATKSQLGFNLGGDAAFFFTRQVGIGVRMTVSRAALKLPMEDGRETEVEAGGVRAGVGVRLRF